MTWIGSGGRADAPEWRAFRGESRPLISAHPRRYVGRPGYLSTSTRQSLAAWAKLSGHFPHPRGYAGQRNARHVCPSRRVRREMWESGNAKGMQVLGVWLNFPVRRGEPAGAGKQEK